MAVQTPRSLLAIEPLPPYTPHETNWETSSVHSAAPSYISAAPSYHSVFPPSTPWTMSPSSARSTRSYQSPHTIRHRRAASCSILNDISDSQLNSLYNITEWVPVSEGLQMRHYHNVAKRRAVEASTGMNLARTIYPFLKSPTESSRSASHYLPRDRNMSPSRSSSFFERPACSRSPLTRLLEDSEDASSSTPRMTTDHHQQQQQQQPRYRLTTSTPPPTQMSAEEEEECKSWDFMTSQMADWQKRSCEELSRRDSVSLRRTSQEGSHYLQPRMRSVIVTTTNTDDNSYHNDADNGDDIRSSQVMHSSPHGRNINPSISKSGSPVLPSSLKTRFKKRMSSLILIGGGSK